MSLSVSKKACVGCGLCVRACPQSALRVENKTLVIDGGRCVLCGECVRACPQSALAIRRERARVHEAGGGIWVFAQRGSQGLLPVALELCACARRLADQSGARVCALLPADSPDEARRLIDAGADCVFTCQSPYLCEALDEPYADWVCALAAQHRPDILLFGATLFGRQLAPRVAARLCTGLTADCTALSTCAETGLLHQTRPAFGGNLMATIITPAHRPQMATVRPGVMPLPEGGAPRRGEIVPTEGPKGPGRVHILSRTPRGQGAGIEKAEVIFSAGRGIGTRKTLERLFELAERAGAQVGVSRPLCDMGWAGREHQIGQTGTSVRPRVLVAFGISGAIQHLAGMTGAKTVIAVNQDPEAPIFGAAQYKLVADAQETIEQLLQSMQ